MSHLTHVSRTSSLISGTRAQCARSKRLPDAQDQRNCGHSPWASFDTYLVVFPQPVPLIVTHESRVLLREKQIKSNINWVSPKTKQTNNRKKKKMKKIGCYSSCFNIFDRQTSCFNILDLGASGFNIFDLWTKRPAELAPFKLFIGCTLKIGFREVSEARLCGSDRFGSMSFPFLFRPCCRTLVDTNNKVFRSGIFRLWAFTENHWLYKENGKWDVISRLF